LRLCKIFSSLPITNPVFEKFNKWIILLEKTLIALTSWHRISVFPITTFSAMKSIWEWLLTYKMIKRTWCWIKKRWEGKTKKMK
jgi:hypothetical protein